MKIIKDQLGNVYKDGEKIHSQVRVMVNDRQQVAVFEGKTRTPPVAVYEPGVVTFDRSGGCSTCQGWPAQLAMRSVWERHEAAHAV